jgi:hypothetical protein
MPSAADVGAVANALIANSKGALITSTGSAVDDLPAGTNGYVLQPDSAQSLGLKWHNVLSNLINLSPVERCNVVASAATGTVNIDLATAGIWYYTSNASANHTLNFRGSSGATLSSLLAVGDSISAVWLNTNGTTPYYPSAVQVDGSAVTPKWLGASAPTGGNASSVDAYTFTIVKTAATPTYLVLASQARFA